MSPHCSLSNAYALFPLIVETYNFIVYKIIYTFVFRDDKLTIDEKLILEKQLILDKQYCLFFCVENGFSYS